MPLVASGRRKRGTVKILVLEVATPVLRRAPAGAASCCPRTRVGYRCLLLVGGVKRQPGQRPTERQVVNSAPATRLCRIRPVRLRQRRMGRRMGRRMAGWLEGTDRAPFDRGLQKLIDLLRWLAEL